MVVPPRSPGCNGTEPTGQRARGYSSLISKYGVKKARGSIYVHRLNRDKREA